MADVSGSIFSQLKESCPAEWESFTHHEFVRQLGDGDLPHACFKHYLEQDYLFLIHFGRAYALAAFKSDDLDEMRQSTATLDALINEEMKLHVAYCAGWGLAEQDMACVSEAPANMAYTRFVLERGLAGDLLDILVALAPCVQGYAEIGSRLTGEARNLRDGNPYSDWIETYAGDDYQSVAAAAMEQLDRVALKRLGASAEASPRWLALCGTFAAATRLESGFWAMGLAATS